MKPKEKSPKKLVAYISRAENIVNPVREERGGVKGLPLPPEARIYHHSHKARLATE